MTLVRALLTLFVLVLSAQSAMAEHCPGFDSAMAEVEAALPPVPAPVVLIPPHG